MKVCITCNETKELAEFHKNKANKDGLKGQCKECAKEYGAKRYAKPEVKQAIAERNARPERKKAKAEYNAKRNARPEIKEATAKRNAKWRAIPAVKEALSEYNSEYYINNQEVILKQKAEYYARPEIKQRQIDKYNNDPMYKTQHKISAVLLHAKRDVGNIRNKQSNVAGLEYTKGQLDDRLSSYMGHLCERCRSISIGNNNSEIDHIIPKSLAEDLEEVIELNHWTNIRIICRECNQDKGSSLDSDNATLPKFAEFYIQRELRVEN